MLNNRQVRPLYFISLYFLYLSSSILFIHHPFVGPSELTFGRTDVIWFNQTTKSFAFHWLRARATLHVKCFSAFDFWQYKVEVEVESSERRTSFQAFCRYVNSHSHTVVTFLCVYKIQLSWVLIKLYLYFIYNKYSTKDNPMTNDFDDP